MIREITLYEVIFLNINTAPCNFSSANALTTKAVQQIYLIGLGESM